MGAFVVFCMVVFWRTCTRREYGCLLNESMVVFCVVVLSIGVDVQFKASIID